MKKVIFFWGILCFVSTWSLNAQRIIWQDDFETSKGWSEYEDESGQAVVKDGALVIKSKEGWIFSSKCKTNLDGNKNFTITADVNVKGGLEKKRYVGLIFDYNDSKNYMAFYVEKGFVWFEQHLNGVIVRQEKDYLKQNKKDNNKQMTFELRKKGQSVMFLVNDEETLEMDGIDVHSNRIGFMVSDDQKVSFDNVKISQ